MSKCYGYIRCSTTEQQISLIAQQDKIKKYAEFKNLPEPELFIESGVSGSIEMKKRPQGKILFEKLQKGDTIIINKIDRISRNIQDFVNSIDYFKKNGIILICLEPELDLASSTGMFVANLLSAVSQLERQFTIERVNATVKKRKEMKLCCGSVPFGWKKNDKKELVEDKNEQEIISQIKEMQKEGLSLSKISTKLNALKVLNKKWYPETIKRILNK